MEIIPPIEQNIIELKNYLKESLCTKEIADFFGLSNSEISDFVNSLTFSRKGISPMFLSPGYGDNDTIKPQIVTTILSNRKETYLHEARHGLHFKLCCAIFERQDTCLEAFWSFCENVLGDQKFVSQIEKNGSYLQRQFIQHARNLQKKYSLLPEDIFNLAVELGALTYQHAYFVDPRMCEAVASYGDTGITKVVGDINRTLASLIPYHSKSALRGYGDKESQTMFKQANPLKKALLVKKDDYERSLFFNSA